MQRLLQEQFDKYRPMFEQGGKYDRYWPLWEGFETFALQFGERTRKGAHIRDPIDMKRMMMFVVFAIVPCAALGLWNIGHQAYVAEGLADPPLFASIVRGMWHMVPHFIVSYAVGGAWELLFCVVRKHEVNEGFFVTAFLFPLTLAPTTPLWMAAMGISFGVVIGKEVFGGVGMNILNPALTARAFVFFAYPASLSGTNVWDVAGIANPLVTRGAETAIDTYTGATPLLAVASAPEGSNAVDVLAGTGWTLWDMAIGNIPGSMGEVSAIAALAGALFLVFTGIASWRIMVSCVLGLVATAWMFNMVAGPESVAMMTLPAHYHLVLGGFAFGCAFMATDPVSGASTLTGMWIYGFLIGFLTVVVRVINPAYPEGVMLAILFMNVFAPLIDYAVTRRAVNRRAARMAAAA